ncbi:hypothetical protein Zmor_000170 [Zophobas morio]|uniref:Uncharacterized protein n=1 Tax=Zophobas morio TaxID=2755281 RepID=A0AA38J264_9CUCU|nr:hypothetical protein Zmor_000170 [Zophobas morio]
MKRGKLILVEVEFFEFVDVETLGEACLLFCSYCRSFSLYQSTAFDVDSACCLRIPSGSELKISSTIAARKTVHSMFPLPRPCDSTSTPEKPEHYSPLSDPANHNLFFIFSPNIIFSAASPNL